MSTSFDTRPRITAEALAELGGPNLVYIREVGHGELEGDVPDEFLTQSEHFYAVHTGDGTRVAVLNDRDAAFVAARQNDMDPVSVH